MNNSKPWALKVTDNPSFWSFFFALVSSCPTQERWSLYAVDTQRGRGSRVLNSVSSIKDKDLQQGRDEDEHKKEEMWVQRWDRWAVLVASTPQMQRGCLASPGQKGMKTIFEETKWLAIKCLRLSSCPSHPCGTYGAKGWLFHAF